MATKLMQIKQDENGVVTCTLSKFDDVGAREGEPEVVEVDSLPSRLLSEFFEVATATFPLPVPEDMTGDKASPDDDPDDPVAQDSGDYVKTELKKYQDSKPKGKPQAAKGKAKH